MSGTPSTPATPCARKTHRAALGCALQWMRDEEFALASTMSSDLLRARPRPVPQGRRPNRRLPRTLYEGLADTHSTLRPKCARHRPPSSRRSWISRTQPSKPAHRPPTFPSPCFCFFCSLRRGRQDRQRLAAVTMPNWPASINHHDHADAGPGVGVLLPRWRVRGVNAVSRPRILHDELAARPAHKKKKTRPPPRPPHKTQKQNTLSLPPKKRYR